MAAIPKSDLLGRVNACQARWMTHLTDDVHTGKSDHARAYLADCRSTFDRHQHELHARQAAAQGVSDWIPSPGASPAAEQARQALSQAAIQSEVAAKAAAKISQAAKGTHRHHARKAFRRSRHKLMRCRRCLARCKARVAAFEQGATPQQAEQAAVAAAPPKHPQDTEGLGAWAIPGQGWAQQYQQVEQRHPWASQLPQQAIAPGYSYRLPSTSSAFLEREAKVAGGHGGVFSGQMQAGVPGRIHPLIAALYPQLVAKPSKPWTNPWSYQQFFDMTPRGMPIWGGGYTQPFKPIQGRGISKPPVANAQGVYAQPGAAVERF